METQRDNNPPAVLWLQWYGKNTENTENTGDVSEADVTHCRERIFDNDIKYLLAAPEATLFADWKEIHWESCPTCGTSPVYAEEADCNQNVYDGVPFGCRQCGAEGYATVNKEEWECYVSWEGHIIKTEQTNKQMNKSKVKDMKDNIIRLTQEKAKLKLERDEAINATRELERDKRRIDWLADKENKIGNVMLPTNAVIRGIASLRDSIDAAMEGDY